MVKQYLESHAYAPELNRLHFVNHGTYIHAPGIVSLSEYRSKNKKITPFIFAEVTTVYDDADKKWLERVYSGSVTKRAEVLIFAKTIEGRLAPGGRCVIKTRLIG